MKKLLLLSFSIIAIIFSACSGAYSVKETNDEFSDPNAPIMKVLENNAIINHDPLGMVPSTELNAYLFADKKTGKIFEMGIYLQHVDGSRNLMIRDGDELIILADKDRIALKAKSTNADYLHSGWNTITKRYYNYFFDFAYYQCSKEEFELIAKANKIKIKIYGANGIRDYGVDFDILAGCVENLKSFYENEIIKGL